MDNLILVVGQLHNQKIYSVLNKDKISYGSFADSIKYNNSNTIHLIGLYHKIHIEKDLYFNLSPKCAEYKFKNNYNLNIHTNNLKIKEPLKNEDIVQVIKNLLIYKDIYNHPDNKNIEFTINLLNICLFSL